MPKMGFNSKTQSYLAFSNCEKPENRMGSKGCQSQGHVMYNVNNLEILHFYAYELHILNGESVPKLRSEMVQTELESNCFLLFFQNISKSNF